MILTDSTAYGQKDKQTWTFLLLICRTLSTGLSSPVDSTFYRSKMLEANFRQLLWQMAPSNTADGHTVFRSGWHSG